MPIPFATGKNPRGIVVADFNRDGLDDVAVANTDLPAGGLAGSVSVHFGKPTLVGADPELELAQTAPLSGMPFELASTDFDQDGVLDLAVVLYGAQQVAVLRGESVAGAASGRFLAPIFSAAGAQPVDLAAADFDLDGKPDLVVVNNTCPGAISLLRGRGDGTFDPPISKDAGCRLTEVAVGDFNSDGVLDAALTGSVDGAIHVMSGVGGGGGFGTVLRLATLGSPAGIRTVDLNGDQILDVLVGCNRSGSQTLLLFFGNGQAGRGDGTFMPPYWVDLKGVYSIVADDLDRDGALDLACTGGTSTAPIHLLQGERKGPIANGSFTTVDRSGPVGASLSISAGDLNGDGQRELVASRFEAGLIIVPSRCGPPQAGGTPSPLTRWRNGGIPIARAPDEQSNVRVTRDGSGGAIIAWQDRRAGAGYDIYAQRIDSEGEALWGPNGRLIGGGPGDQRIPEIAPDDAGGAWIAWTDARTNLPRVKLQHVGPSGAPIPPGWPADGLEVFPGRPGHLWEPRVVPDGAGGVYLMANDHLFEFGFDRIRLTCSRFLPSGALSPGWPAVGTVVGTGAEFTNPDVSWSDITGQSIVASPAGGVVITFLQVDRGRTLRQAANQVVSVGPAGNVLWTTNPSRSLPTVENAAAAVPDGRGGAFLLRINPTLQAWPFRSNGLVDAPTDFGPPQGAVQSLQGLSAGGDGVFALWYAPSGGGGTHFMTRLDSGGRIAEGWPGPGVPIVEGNWAMSGQRAIDDGAGGVLVCWEDRREYDAGIYLIRRAPDGGLVPGWKQDGWPVVAAPTDQLGPSIAMVDSRTAVVAWVDWRSGTPDVYAQSISVDPAASDPASPLKPWVGGNEGELDVTLPSVITSRRLQLTMASPGHGPVEIAILDIQGRVFMRQTVNAGSRGPTRVELDISPNPAGLYWVRVQYGGRTIQRRIVALR